MYLFLLAVLPLNSCVLFNAIAWYHQLPIQIIPGTNVDPVHYRMYSLSGRNQFMSASMEWMHSWLS